MKSKIKRNLAGGIIVLAPVAVTLFVVLWIYNRIASIIPAKYTKALEVTKDPTVNEFIKVVVFLMILLVILIMIGWLVRTTLGVFLQKLLDALANRIPGLRMVYNATKMAIETVLGGTGEFQTPVKIEVKGMRLTAFKTGNQTSDGREIIFLPTAPNITTGFVIELDEDKIQETDETVEEALTRILSAGFGDNQSQLIQDTDGLTGDNQREESD